MIKRRTRAALILVRALSIGGIAVPVVVVGTTLLAPMRVAHAAPDADATKDAGKHFNRGVALFNEADYPGALVEFKRAYEIAPNPAVLYNIGQTYFQLRSYATALQTFERYLAEAGANADHKADAESASETLRSRVGKIDVVAPDGAEITIDDEVAGKTPLPPILAAVGKRRIAGTTRDGRAMPARVIEVSAGETTKIELKIDPGSAAQPSGGGPIAGTPPDKDTPPPRHSSALPTILWIGAGALAAGAITTGVLSLSSASDLSSERKKFPSSRSRLDDLGDKTKTFALVTDILGGAAIVTGGVALYLTLSGPSSSSSATSATTPTTAVNMKVRLSPTSAALVGSF